MWTRILLLACTVLLGRVLTIQGKQLFGETIVIAFKYVNEHSLIWSDEGSDADRDVSIWHPIDIESGYYPLGDTATPSHEEPPSPSLTVSALVDDALAPPTGFTEIWNDRGSDADKNVRVMKMDAPDGYTCLGHVAVRGYKNKPDKKQYRCVKSEYVVFNSGTYDLIWKDRGSGADDNVALWANTNIESDLGIDALTFSAFTSYSDLAGKPNLLKSTVAKHRSLLTQQHSDRIAIVIYEVTETERIWTDKGSRADEDFSSYRAVEPEGYYSLGDIGVATHSKPAFSILVQQRKSDVLIPPTGYRKRWTDKGSGANRNVAFYEPICPSGSRALGYVTVRSHSSAPSENDIRCVNSTYIVSGKWKFVWDDTGSGANTDVTVWRAVPSGQGQGQGVRAMSAVPCHCDMDRTAYVLNLDYVQYVTSKPVKRYILTSLQYMLENYNVLSQEPEVLARTIIFNHGDTEQVVTRSIEYSYEETYSWDETSGLEVGVEISVTAGVPEVFSGSVTVSTTASYSYTTGESDTEAHADSVDVEILVQPRSSKTASITSNRYIADVPYTAVVTPEYTDGTIGDSYVYRGVYNGVQINEITVIYDADVPIETEM